MILANQGRLVNSRCRTEFQADPPFLPQSSQRFPNHPNPFLLPCRSNWITCGNQTKKVRWVGLGVLGVLGVLCVLCVLCGKMGGAGGYANADEVNTDDTKPQPA